MWDATKSSVRRFLRRERTVAEHLKILKYDSKYTWYEYLNYKCTKTVYFCVPFLVRMRTQDSPCCSSLKDTTDLIGIMVPQPFPVKNRCFICPRTEYLSRSRKMAIFMIKSMPFKSVAFTLDISQSMCRHRNGHKHIHFVAFCNRQLPK